ncbi:restriction endonuclease subunit S [Wenyingzhuangia sp. IMCC45574]
MEKYRYKDSSIEWLGAIPEHWEVTKIKKEFKVQPSNVNKKAKEDEEEVLLCNYVDVYYNNYITNDIDFMGTATASENEIKKFQLEIGDVIITKDSEDPLDIGVPALVKETQEKLLCGYHLSMLRSVRNKIDGAFLFWSLNNEFIASQLFREATGVTRWAIASRHIKNSSFAYPPLQEQRAIAEYLDKATAKIDRIIAIKQEQLVTMEEMRKSKYQEIITKGLNKSVEFTKSNIPSLGKYPKHWKLIKLKLVSKRIGDGMHSTPIYTEGTDYPFINGNNLINGRITIKEKTRTVSKAEFEKHKLNISSNTVLISINGTIGNLALYNNEKVVFGKSSAYIDALSFVNREFLYFFLKSYYIKDLIELSLEGTTVRNLSLNTIRNLKILLPPKEEQVKIVDFLNTFSRKIELEIKNINSQIKTLQAYRKSLIHECVTGKKQITSAIKKETYA